jgi:hypothetical protein
MRGGSDEAVQRNNNKTRGKEKKQQGEKKNLMKVIEGEK